MKYRFGVNEIKLLQRCVQDCTEASYTSIIQSVKEKESLNKLCNKIIKVNEKIEEKIKSEIQITPILFLMQCNEKGEEESKKLLLIKNVIYNHLKLISLIDTSFERFSELKKELREKLKDKKQKRIFELLIDIENLITYNSALTQVNSRSLDEVFNLFWNDIPKGVG